ncbi:MAG: HAD family phosphatase [Acidimicrobiia bacterium]|nr:HAD family phosphatase [Acidimicrobiia bacterium]
MIRLIAVDIDGTLLDSAGQVPDANREALAAAVARGVDVVLVTGRSYPFARPVADSLAPGITLIASNGAIERAQDGTTLSRSLLDREVARAVLGATGGFRHAAALIFDREHARQMLFESMDWTAPNRKGYWERNRRLIERCAPLEQALVEDPVAVMFNGGVEEMRVLARLLGEGGDGFATSVTEYEDRDFTLVDVTAVEATKGRAVARTAARLGLSPGQVMAVGDNFNDIEMLEFAGRPVVMGNAAAPLRARGWAVTGSHDEAGLAQAIRTFVLDG